MATSERTATAIAAAVVGVLGTLLTLLLLVSQVDAHYVTRREYEATLLSINGQLSEIKTTVDREHAQARADRANR